MNDLIHRRDEGFTLLEVIVAFVVLSLSLIAVNKSVALATTQIKRADEVQRAEVLAQLIWANVLLSDHGIAQRSRGESGEGLRWELSAYPVDTQGKIAMTRVSLVIRSTTGRHIRDYTTFLPKPMMQ